MPITQSKPKTYNKANHISHSHQLALRVWREAQRTSVPELVNRTISTEGTAAMTILARMFSLTDGAPKDVPFSKVAYR